MEGEGPGHSLEPLKHLKMGENESDNECQIRSGLIHKKGQETRCHKPREDHVCSLVEKQNIQRFLEVAEECGTNRMHICSAWSFLEKNGFNSARQVEWYVGDKEVNTSGKNLRGVRLNFT